MSCTQGNPYSCRLILVCGVTHVFVRMCTDIPALKRKSSKRTRENKKERKRRKKWVREKKKNGGCCKHWIWTREHIRNRARIHVSCRESTTFWKRFSLKRETRKKERERKKERASGSPYNKKSSCLTSRNDTPYSPSPSSPVSPSPLLLFSPQCIHSQKYDACVTFGLIRIPQLRWCRFPQVLTRCLDF